VALVVVLTLIAGILAAQSPPRVAAGAARTGAGIVPVPLQAAGDGDAFIEKNKTRGQEPALVTATKTVAGAPLPAGLITYTIVLTNSGGGPQNDNPGDEFTDALPGSLILFFATATSGTLFANLDTETVTWNGGIPAGGSVVITINAIINVVVSACNDPLVAISNQGTCFYDSDGDDTNDATCVTDDPATPTPGDPTILSVAGGAVCEIPTLSELGLALLCVALAGAALLLLRRRRAV